MVYNIHEIALKGVVPMDTYIYEITESVDFVEDTGSIKTYGIRIYNADKKIAGRKNESCRVDSISPDYPKIAAFKQMLEEFGLYPIHLRDVVEDFLSSQSL